MLKRIAQLESELNKAKTSYSVIHFHDQLAKTQRLELHNRTKTKQVEELETHIKALGKVADRHAKEGSFFHLPKRRKSNEGHLSAPRAILA